MKQQATTFLLIMLMSMVGAKAFAHDIYVNGVYYNVGIGSAHGTAEVTFAGEYSTSYADEYKGVIVIPKKIWYNNIGEMVVTTIGRAAFSNCSSLTSIAIPSTITSIDNSAFYGCI